MQRGWMLRNAVPVALIGFLLIGYWHALGLPFLNDDYFFLERVRDRSFLQLWLPDQLYFHWYRPWSRELHYWVLNRLAGLDEPRFHMASFALWLATMLLYFRLVERLAGRSSAAVSTAGLAAAGLWSGPLLWIAGAQDLWMVLFCLLVLHAVVSGSQSAAALAMVLALLSKETAVVMPAVAAAYCFAVSRLPFREVFKRTWALWTVVAVWAVCHPTLREHLSGRLNATPETQQRPAALGILIKTALAQFNLEDRIAPDSGWGWVWIRGAAGASALVGIVWLCRSSRSDKASESANGDPTRRVIRFGAVWAVLGFAVLFLPSIGWHAYYGVVGSLGFWLALGTWLSRYRRASVVVIAALALLREARASTPSWDWGTDWYQSRAGAILAGIRGRLFRLHPTLAPHSRLYFARIPNNIGMIAGDGPAVRIWYNDPTLQARFYSEYVQRAGDDSLGGDHFFRFDSVLVLVEIDPGPEAFPEALRSNPGWQHDHEVLASMFIQSGNIRGAAAEYAKLSRTHPNRQDYALYAGAAHDAAGDRAEAAEFYRAAIRIGGDPLSIRRRAEDLIENLPRPRAP